MEDDFEELQDAVMNDQVLIDWWVRDGGVYDPDMERGVGPGHMPGLSLSDFIEDNYDDLRDYVNAKEMKEMKAQYDVERPSVRNDDGSDDDSGYDKDDPKHPGYADRMAALIDQERDRRKYGESATRGVIDALFEESFGGYGNKGTGGVARAAAGYPMGDPGAEVHHAQKHGDAYHRGGTSACCGSDIYLDGTCAKCGHSTTALEDEEEVRDTPPLLRRRHEAKMRPEHLTMDVHIPGPAPHGVDAVRAALVAAFVPARNIIAVDSWERLDDEGDEYEVTFYAQPGTKALMGDL